MTRNDIAKEYVRRVSTIAGVKAVALQAGANNLTFFTLVNFPNRRNVYSVYEVEWEMQRAHPDLDIGFTIIDLADVDRQVALGAIPSGAKSLLPLRA